MARVTRPDRQVYIARAVLADSRYVEAQFDSWDHIEIHGAVPAEIDHDRVTLKAMSGYFYTPSLYGVYDRGAGPAAADIPEWEFEYARLRAHGYAIVGYKRYDNGLWFLRVTTGRGRYDVPRIPGESADNFLKAAGLGTVP